MQIGISIALGLIQGFTEFLPVSSSGHLILARLVMPLELVDTLAFDVIVHLGTLLALLAYFWRDIKRLAIAWGLSIKRKDRVVGERRADARLAWIILIGTVPAAMIGVLARDYLILFFRTPVIVAAALMVGGLLLILVERMNDRQMELHRLTWQAGITIGIAQALALIPGTSRSGITIIAGLLAGFRRDDAARFAFLLGIPIIAGASVVQVVELARAGVTLDQAGLLGIGLIASFFSGYFVVKYFILFLKKYSLAGFGIYRILLGAAILALWYGGRIIW